MFPARLSLAAADCGKTFGTDIRQLRTTLTLTDICAARVPASDGTVVRHNSIKGVTGLRANAPPPGRPEGRANTADMA
ncbi:MAG: hypothetical protein ACK5YB_14495 [Burkholderiales bacterium]